jgi:SAM-dependent methyltransferase
MSEILLDLGSGDGKNTPPGDWIKIDKNPYFKPDICRDIEYGLPFCDQTCSVVRTFHVCEHIHDMVFLSNEIFRVLKPGGRWLIDGPHYKSEAAWSDFTHVRALGVNADWQLHAPHPQAGLNCRFKTVEKYDSVRAEAEGSIHFVLESGALHPTIGSTAHAKHGNLALDLGSGGTSNDLGERFGDDVFNLDVDWTLLGHGVPNLIIRDVDRHGLPFCNDSAQYIRGRDFFEHCRNFTGLMNDIYRVLRPGGILEIKGPAPHSDFDFGNPDHVRRIGTYTIDHFIVPIPCAGILTRFKVIQNEIYGPYLFAKLEVDKSQPLPEAAVYSSERIVS